MRGDSDTTARGFAVASALEDSDELWAALARESPGHVLTDPPTSRGRLWRPSRFVEVAAPLVLRALADRGPVPPALFSLTGADFDAATTAPVSTGPDGELTLGDGAVVGARVSFLDVACGSGRDSVWLASVFSRASGSEWRGVAVDINKRAVERARAFLGRAGAPGAVAFGAMDTEADFPSSVAPAVTALAESAGAAVPFDVVLCVRYLHRPLLPCLASLVRPGGFILYQTFLEGASHPREPRHLLRRGELASLYGVLGFDAVVDCEGRIADGRPMSYYVGRRRGEG
eukprot:Opistho-1_new@28416